MAPSDTPPFYRYRECNVSARNGKSSITKALFGTSDCDAPEQDQEDDDVPHLKSRMHSDPEGIPLSRVTDRQRHGSLHRPGGFESRLGNDEHQSSHQMSRHEAQPIDLSRTVDKRRHGGYPTYDQGGTISPRASDPFLRQPFVADTSVFRLFSSPPLLQPSLATNLSCHSAPLVPQNMQSFPTALTADMRRPVSTACFGSLNNVSRQASASMPSVSRQASASMPSVSRQKSIEVIGGPGNTSTLDVRKAWEQHMSLKSSLDLQVPPSAPVNKSALDLQSAWERHGVQKPLRQVCMSARDTISMDPIGALTPPPLPSARSMTSTPMILPPPVLTSTPPSVFTPRQDLPYSGLNSYVPTGKNESFTAPSAGAPIPQSARPPPQTSRGKSESFVSRSASQTPRLGPPRKSLAASSTPPMSPRLGSCPSPMHGGARSMAPSASAPVVAPACARSNSFQPPRSSVSITPPPGNRMVSSVSTGALPSYMPSPRVPSYVPTPQLPSYVPTPQLPSYVPTPLLPSYASPRSRDRMPRSNSSHSPAYVTRMKSVTSSVPAAATPPPARVTQNTVPANQSNFSYKAPTRYTYDGFNLQETAAAIKAALQASAAAQRMLVKDNLSIDRIERSPLRGSSLF